MHRRLLPLRRLRSLAWRNPHGVSARGSAAVAKATFLEAPLGQLDGEIGEELIWYKWNIMKLMKPEFGNQAQETVMNDTTQTGQVRSSVIYDYQHPRKSHSVQICTIGSQNHGPTDHQPTGTSWFTGELFDCAFHLASTEWRFVCFETI